MDASIAQALRLVYGLRLTYVQAAAQLGVSVPDFARRVATGLQELAADLYPPASPTP
jgi:predicted DNA-binding protein (UPF0251 family)